MVKRGIFVRNSDAKIFTVFRKSRSLAVALLAGGSLACSAATAQSPAAYPNKPIRFVVPQGPGGAADIQARLFAQKLNESLGKPVIVDNRLGSGITGLTTLAIVAKANPDGYTLMQIATNFVFANALAKDTSVDPVKDFAPISLLAKSPLLLVTNPAFAAKSVQELIALAHANPGKLNFGGGSIGTGTHLITMRFLNATRIDATFIPYKSTGPALLDLIGGRIDASMTSVISSGPHVKAGRLRALGINTATRSQLLPEMPTLAEQGVSNFDAFVFVGWVAPAQTPDAIVNKLSVEAAKAARATDVTAALRADGGEPVGSTPLEFKRFIASEVPRWSKLISELDIKAVPE
jgi:tripartite-type tricarboxylate transporter receptor subunit TctC